ncbi:hypothetical protein GCM10028818_33090 [Spirosoma horti]
MNHSEQVNEILRRKDYRNLNSRRLKPTPDLTYAAPVLRQDDLDETKLILEYERQLQIKKNQRGY